MVKKILGVEKGEIQHKRRGRKPSVVAPKNEENVKVDVNETKVTSEVSTEATEFIDIPQIIPPLLTDEEVNEFLTDVDANSKNAEENETLKKEEVNDEESLSFNCCESEEETVPDELCADPYKNVDTKHCCKEDLNPKAIQELIERRILNDLELLETADKVFIDKVSEILSKKMRRVKPISKAKKFFTKTVWNW